MAALGCPSPVAATLMVVLAAMAAKALSGMKAAVVAKAAIAKVKAILVKSLVTMPPPV
jgi:hypothetical protein